MLRCYTYRRLTNYKSLTLVIQVKPLDDKQGLIVSKSLIRSSNAQWGEVLAE